MRRFGYFKLGMFLFLLLALAPLTRAQSQTIVTATVTDPNGIPYAGGTVKATLAPPGIASPCVVVLGNCVPIAGTIGPAFLDGTGSFTMNLYPNASILCGGQACTTQWTFTVCISPGVLTPFGTGPQCFSVPETISGSAQSLSTALSLAAPALTVDFAPQAPSATFGIILSPACGATPNCFTVHDNGVNTTGCTWSTASQTITCPSGTFAASNVGEQIDGFHTCQTNASSYSVDFTAGTTISTYISSSQVSISTTPLITESAGGTTGCVFFGTSDDAGFAAAMTAWYASSQCLSIEMPSGIMFLDNPFDFFGVEGLPAACKSREVYVGLSNSPVYRLVGQGQGATVIYLPSTFAFNDCHPGIGAGNGACFWATYGDWNNFQFNGGGEGGANSWNVTQESFLIEAAGLTGGPQTFTWFEHVGFYNILPTNENLMCLWSEEYETYFILSTEDGCGGTGLWDGSGVVWSFGSSFEDNEYGMVTVSDDGDNQALFKSLGRTGFFGTPLMGSASGYINVNGASGEVVLSPTDYFVPNGGPSSWYAIILNGSGAGVYSGGGRFGVTGTAGLNGIELNGPNQVVQLAGFYATSAPTAIINGTSSATGATLLLENVHGGAVTFAASLTPTATDLGNNSFSSTNWASGTFATLWTSQQGSVTAGHVATWVGTNGQLEDGGTPGEVVQSTSRTTLASNISLSANTPTTVVSKTVTMPSSGCPCRVIAEYTIYLATNNWTGTSWVTDGTNIFGSGQTTGTGTNVTGISASEMSQTTYANSATPTFTLTFEDNGSGGTINAAAAQGSATNTFLTLTVVTSN